MSEVIIDNIKFKNVPDKHYGTKVNDILTQSNIGISADVAEYIQSQDFYALVNGLDIDWNGIEVEDGLVLNTTADLINWIKTKGGGSAVEQIQSDWNQNDSSKKDYIKNKPTIPNSVVLDDVPTEGSQHAVKSGGVFDELELCATKQDLYGLTDIPALPVDDEHKTTQDYQAGSIFKDEIVPGDSSQSNYYVALSDGVEGTSIYEFSKFISCANSIMAIYQSMQYSNVSFAESQELTNTQQIQAQKNIGLEKAVPDGVASLNANGVIPAEQLPDEVKNNFATEADIRALFHQS